MTVHSGCSCSSPLSVTVLQSYLRCPVNLGSGGSAWHCGTPCDAHAVPGRYTSAPRPLQRPPQRLYVDGVGVLLTQGLVLLGVERLALQVDVAHLCETGDLVRVRPTVFYTSLRVPLTPQLLTLPITKHIQILLIHKGWDQWHSFDSKYQVCSNTGKTHPPILHLFPPPLILLKSRRRREKETRILCMRFGTHSDTSLMTLLTN